jgi:hypothetical protein
MPPEEKKKIQAWVPVSIWNQIESFGFKSQNETVNTAFEKLRTYPKCHNGML